MSLRMRSLVFEFSKAAGIILGPAVVLGGVFTAVAHGVDAGLPEIRQFAGMGGGGGLVLGSLLYGMYRVSR
ncbi:MAG: hypothetical protein K9G62_04190 [Alphaproteobacteria bacterium]|nr:hypothetical protein [Alphaproteobacteria bacterium]